MSELNKKLAEEKLIDQESLVERAHTLRVQIDDPGPWGSYQLPDPEEFGEYDHSTQD